MPFIHHDIPYGFEMDEIEDGHLRGKVIIVTGSPAEKLGKKSLKNSILRSL